MPTSSIHSRTTTGHGERPTTCPSGQPASRAAPATWRHAGTPAVRPPRAHAVVERARAARCRATPRHAYAPRVRACALETGYFVASIDRIISLLRAGAAYMLVAAPKTDQARVPLQLWQFDMVDLRACAHISAPTHNRPMDDFRGVSGIFRFPSRHRK